LPDIDSKIYQEYKDQGVLVYGLYQGESASALDDFQEQTGVSFPLVNDPGTLNQFAFPSGVGYPYPRDVVVDKNLKVRSIKNSFNAKEMDTLVKQLLAE
jgi:hypothetical protein